MFYAFQMNQGHAEQSQIQEMLGKTVLPLFGLDNESATYPFVDLWGLPHGSMPRAHELAKALPNDSQMLNLFRYYKEMAYVIYAGVVSPEQLEADMTSFLINRSAQYGTEEGVSEAQIYGKSYNWLALLFAVLASGAQCSGMPRKERELTSQVYSRAAETACYGARLTRSQSVAVSSVSASRISSQDQIWKAYSPWSSLAMS